MKKSPKEPSPGARPYYSGLSLVLILFAILSHPGCSRNPLKHWTPDRRLTDHLGISQTPNNNAHGLAALGDTIHLVWYDLREVVESIYYIRSTDGGTTWGREVRLSPPGLRSRYPSLAASRSNVFVVWSETRPDGEFIRFRRSPDIGSAWDTAMDLSPKRLLVAGPSLAVSGSILHVAWGDSVKGNQRIWYRRSPDGGTTWEPETCLTPPKALAQRPALAAEGSRVQVVWMDSLPGNWEIYSIRSSDGGISWGAPERLTKDPARSQHPAIGSDGSLVVMAWEDDRNGGRSRIFLKRSTDGGQNWGSEWPLNDTPYPATYPTLALVGQTIHLVWDAWFSGNNDEIMYKLSRDGGKTWEPDLRLTQNLQYSSIPSLAVSGPGVHVIWEDYRDANREIYFKSNPTGNLPPGRNLFKALWNHPATRTLEVVLFFVAVFLVVYLMVKLILATGKGAAAGDDEKKATTGGKLLRKRSAEAEKRYQLGQDLAAKGKWPEAERIFREVLRLSPEDAQAHLLLGAVLEGQGKEDKAEAAYRKAIWFAPDEPEAHFRLAGLLERKALHLGQADHLEPHAFPDGTVAREIYHNAEWEYHEATRLRPNFAEALKGMAALLDAQKRGQDARRYWKRALAAEKDPREKERIQERLAADKEAEEEEAELAESAGVSERDSEVEEK